MELNYDTALVAFGGAVKALDNQHIGGYLVRFSTADDPDLRGDFFSKATDFGFADTLTSPIYLNHTAPLATRDGKNVIVKEKIGEATLAMDEIGILVDAVLYNREIYENMLDSLGWSSGTAAHLVQREPVGKAYHITRWPLGLDASLTPIPAEPRNAVVPFKSLFAPNTEPEPETPEGGGNPPAEPEAIEGDLAAAKAAIEIQLSELNLMEV
ncbi:MAG: hypothetical protein DRJ03_26405 [Chloroflexi bacterium]|nr:MAG: hypothetical protein DRJ03_26405 [Chloroflexota bacterium]